MVQSETLVIGKFVVRPLVAVGFVAIGLAMTCAGEVTLYHLLALICYPACVPLLLILGDRTFEMGANVRYFRRVSREYGISGSRYRPILYTEETDKAMMRLALVIRLVTTTVLLISFGLSIVWIPVGWEVIGTVAAVTALVFCGYGMPLIWAVCDRAFGISDK